LLLYERLVSMDIVGIIGTPTGVVRFIGICMVLQRLVSMGIVGIMGTDGVE